MSIEKKRSVKITAAMTALALLMSGCSVQAPEKSVEMERTQLRIIHSGGDLKWKNAIEAVAEAFMEENPEIEVVLVSTPEIKNRTYIESLKVMAAQEAFYDIVELRETRILAETGLLAPIPETISSLVNTTQEYQGVCYGVPRYATTHGIIYQADLFEELGLSAPTTYEEFLQICDRIKSAGIQPLTLGAADIWHMKFWGSYLFQNYIAAEGEPIVWSRERTENMLSDFRELAKRGYINPSCRNMSDSQTAQALSSDEAAMVLTGPWMLPQIETLNPQIHLGFFFLPGRDGSVYAMQDANVDWGISAQTAENEKKWEAAERFLQFYYSEGIYETVLETMNAEAVTVREVQMPDTENQRIIAQAYGCSPIQTRMLLDEGLSPEGFNVYYEQLLLEALWGTETIPELADQLIKAWEGT